MSRMSGMLTDTATTPPAGDKAVLNYQGAITLYFRMK